MKWMGGALVAGVVACTTTQPPPPAKPEPASSASAMAPSAASAASPAPTKIDTSSWTKDWPKTWTDPRVIEALAQKCDFAPTESPKADGFGGRRNLFTCTVYHPQSCNPDFCFSAGDTCEHECTKTCLDCGGTCAKSCESCKSGCKDASCTHKCAETCADCKQDCEAKLDHCASADCRKKHAECEKKVSATWKTNGCKAKCTRYQSCTSVCDKAKDPEKCRDSCDAQLSPGWKACNDKCNALRDAKKDDEAEACLGDCYTMVPCAPFICQIGGL